MSDSPRVLGAGDTSWTLLLSHGAGVSTDSRFFAELADRLLTGGLRLALFDFPFMQERARTGKRRPPDRMPVLQQAYREAIDALGPDAGRVVIGGKSMGGRVASLIADDEQVAGLVCLGYPFHPRGQPGKLRTSHLADLATPTLICQGTRDPLGNREEVERYSLSPSIRFEWLPDGDHDLVPRKRSGHTREENWDVAAAAIVEFIGTLR